MLLSALSKRAIGALAMVALYLWLPMPSILAGLFLGAAAMLLLSWVSAVRWGTDSDAAIGFTGMAGVTAFLTLAVWAVGGFNGA